MDCGNWRRLRAIAAQQLEWRTQGQTLPSCPLTDNSTIGAALVLQIDDAVQHHPF